MAQGSSINVSTANVGETVRALTGIRRGQTRVLNRAINRTLTFTRKRADQEIRKEIRLPSRYVKGKLRRKKSNFSTLTGAIQAGYRGTLLSYYMKGARFHKSIGSVIVPVQWNRGDPVKVRVSPNSRLAPLKAKPGYSEPWVMGRMPNSGAVGIFMTPKGGGKPEVQYGPSVSQVYNTIKPRIAAEASQKLAENAAREADALLKRYR